MGSLLRSEDMTLLRLYFDRAAAHDTIDELGKLGVLQFNDLNHQSSMFQRAYAADVRRCEEMMRKIRFFHKEIEKVPEIDKVYQAEIDKRRQMIAPTVSEHTSLTELDSRLSSFEVSLKDILQNYDALVAQHSSMTELRFVLEKAAKLFQNAPTVSLSEYGTTYLDSTERYEGEEIGGTPGSTDPAEGTIRTGPRAIDRLLRPGSLHLANTSMLLSFYTGVIDTNRVPSFQRILFRATRGNCFYRFDDITEPIFDPEAGQNVLKTVFVVFYSGVEIKNKISKICVAMHATKYPFPEDVVMQQQAYSECRTRLRDLAAVLQQTQNTRSETLLFIAQRLPLWSELISREKAIYHNMNMLNFDTSSKLFIAEGWCPTSSVGEVNMALEVGKRRARVGVNSIMEERVVGHHVTPPTYFKTNRFTEVFHAIPQAYATACYKELNPAVFTIVTFPFLFAVMFGDIGHGIVMALVAFLIIRAEQQLKMKKLDEMTVTVYEGRYIIFLMGLFSIFTGLIYNEFFAIPLDFFGSRWVYTAESAMACGADNCADPAKVLPPLSPYPLGFDPIWKSSQTGLLFFNSYKMKLSVVLGVMQMVMGIICSYFNATFFKHDLDIKYVFIPQMIFMNSTFGYLVLLIFIKWFTNWNAPGAGPAPDLKAVMIQMFMAPGNVPKELQLYPGQGFVQVILLFLALVSVPWMLLPKPLILKKRHEVKMSKKYKVVSEDLGERARLLGGGKPESKVAEALASTKLVEHDDDEEDDEFDFSDVMVNQMIHTIEFVLGAVSNTASYLRLWALSLAHAELSDVFLEKLLFMTVSTGNLIAMVIGFFLWLGATIGVLMLMESLSAFLHTLRLHWVEFQNKFYSLHGDGTKFEPFSYATLDVLP